MIRYMQMSIDGLHFKRKIMDYTNLLLIMNDLKKEKTLQEDLFYFPTVNI